MPIVDINALQYPTFDAVSFDTSVFDPKRSFYAVSLRAFLFKSRPKRLILSQATIDECAAHNATAIEALISTARSTARSMKDFEVCDAAVSAIDLSWPADQDTKQLAIDRSADHMRAFADDVFWQEIIGYDYVATSQLFESYFNRNAPFDLGSGKDPKPEFPDAVALFSLEKWGIENNQSALVVSADKDWASFAATSARLFLVPNLSTALAVIDDNRFLGAVLSDIVDSIYDHMQANLVVFKTLRNEIDYRLTNAEFEENNLLRYKFLPSNRNGLFCTVIDHTDVEARVSVQLRGEGSNRTTVDGISTDRPFMIDADMVLVIQRWKDARTLGHMVSVAEVILNGRVRLMDAADPEYIAEIRGWPH